MSKLKALIQYPAVHFIHSNPIAIICSFSHHSHVTRILPTKKRGCSGIEQPPDDVVREIVSFKYGKIPYRKESLLQATQQRFQQGNQRCQQLIQ
ncbi:hypothetical protein [Chitinophaga sp. ARDCPP14]|uniref:hypothetical protein n=1 Tax=Chitinophaga sp. ARDCPP14 TaxID=3391139 RepID=UPI003F51BAF3